MKISPEFELGSFIVGIAVGFAFCACVAYYSVTKEVHEKRTICESSLPRNQNCEMQFIPEVKK